MKKHYTLATTVATLLISISLFAQDMVPKMPVYEIFSSSTCPPCRPANEHLTPLFEHYKGELAIVKYQVNWPGAGDPYFTSEVGSRRSSYSVNSVPSVFRNAEGILATNFDTVKINADLDEMCSMKMDLRYMIDTNVQWVRVRARIEALDDYSSNGHRLMIPILENTTYKNKETNGETEFHNVFKKMLPESNGELIIGEIEAGEVIEYDSTYTFQGDYRLPNSAQDPINHATEHSIEEFDDIHVVMFMQSLVNREIYQGAIGVREFTEANMDRDWGDDRLWPLSIAEFNKNKGFVVSPNPANGFTSVHFSKDFNAERIELVDVQGRVVLSKTAPFAQKFNLSVSDLVSGVYFFRAQSSEGLIQTKKMIVHH